MMNFSKTSDSRFSKLPLLILWLLIYSRSSVLTMSFLSLYGLIQGVARVPRKRVNAVKSLLHYGVEVLEHGLGTSIKVANS